MENFQNSIVEEEKEKWELPFGVTPDDEMEEIRVFWSRNPRNSRNAIDFTQAMLYMEWLFFQPPTYRMPESIDDEIRRISECWDNEDEPMDLDGQRYYRRDMRYLDWLKKEKANRSVKEATTSSSDKSKSVEKAMTSTSNQPDHSTIMNRLHIIRELPFGVTPDDQMEEIMVFWSRQPRNSRNALDFRQDMEYVEWLFFQPDTYRMPESIDDEIRRISECWDNGDEPMDLDGQRYYRRDMRYLNWLKKEKEDRAAKEATTSSSDQSKSTKEATSSSSDQSKSAKEAMTATSSIMKRLHIVAQRDREVRRFNTTGTEYIFEVDDTDLSIGDFYGVFDELINLVVKDFEPDNMVGIQLSLDGLDRVIYHPFTQTDQLTTQRLLDILEKVVQSNAKVSLKNIEVKVIRVRLSKGGMALPKLVHSSMHEFLRRKRCIVTVSGDDELCFGRCF